MKRMFDREISSEEHPDIFLDGAMETREDWPRLREVVMGYYRENRVDGKLIEQFNIHNKQVEDFVIEFSRKEGFTEKEQEIAVLAAIMHDITKGYGDFLKHGEEGGQLAEKMLLGMGKSPELAWSVRLAIERHMGQAGYPTKKAREAYGENFEYPKYSTEVGQLVYECDILTQLTPEGFSKILLLRSQDKNDLAEDMKRAKEEKDSGMTVEKARFLSVLKSAQESYDIIRSGKLNSIREEADKFWQRIQEKYKEYL